jgi:hypothetical protein
MASLAFDTCLCMLAMIEPHKRGDLVDTHPIHIPILFAVRRQFLFGLGLWRNGRMALKALRNFRHIHHLAISGGGVTQMARLFQLRNVQFMVELNRLLRPPLFLILRIRSSNKDQGRRYHNHRSHRLPARICSAM